MRILRTQKRPFVILFIVVLGLAGLESGGAAGLKLATRSAALPQNLLNRAEVRARANTAYAGLPLSFEENRGQA